MSTPRQPDLDDAIAEVERELALRHRVYPKWITTRKLPEARAHWQIACMERVLAELREAATWLPKATRLHPPA